MISLYLFAINFMLLTATNAEEFNGNQELHFLNQYNRYDTIIEYLQYLRTKYPQYVTLITIGTTYNQRDIFAIKLSSNKHDKKRPSILIDAGVHAREWISTAVALGLIHQLLSVNNTMLDAVDWLIVPVLNPDGYEYSHTTNNLWRKNRVPGDVCAGVDINRNFGFHWGEEVGSNKECSYQYHGPKPFSEPESRAIADLALNYQNNIKLYVSLHAYGQTIIYPWSYANVPVSKHFEATHKALGLLAARKISTIRGTKYTVGRVSDVLYLASGTSIDWMASEAKIPLCYVFELNSDRYQFKAPTREILPITQELFVGFKVFYNYILEVEKGNKN